MSECGVLGVGGVGDRLVVDEDVEVAFGRESPPQRGDEGDEHDRGQRDADDLESVGDEAGDQRWATGRGSRHDHSHRRPGRFGSDPPRRRPSQPRGGGDATSAGRSGLDPVDRLDSVP